MRTLKKVTIDSLHDADFLHGDLLAAHADQIFVFQKYAFHHQTTSNDLIKLKPFYKKRSHFINHSLLRHSRDMRELVGGSWQ